MKDQILLNKVNTDYKAQLQEIADILLRLVTQ